MFLVLDYIKLEREMNILYQFLNLFLASYINPVLQKIKKPPGDNFNDSYLLSLKNVIIPVPENYILMDNVVYIYPAYYFLWDLQLWKHDFYYFQFDRTSSKLYRWYVRLYTRFKSKLRTKERRCSNCLCDV